jgi:hypothetical protein
VAIQTKLALDGSGSSTCRCAAHHQGWHFMSQCHEDKHDILRKAIMPLATRQRLRIYNRCRCFNETWRY